MRLKKYKTEKIRRKNNAVFWRRFLSAVLPAVFLFAAPAALTGCGGDLPQERHLLKMEAERAIIEGTPSTGRLFIVTANSKSNYVTSNAKYITNLNSGNVKITWFFSVDKDGITDLYLLAANGIQDAGGFSVGGSGNDVFTVSVNDTEVFVPETQIAAASRYLDSWQYVKIPSVKTTEGLNTVSVIITDTKNAVNIDYLAVDKQKASTAEEHTHDWQNETLQATCTEPGKINKRCRDCGQLFFYENLLERGHEYGDFHYDSAIEKMAAQCIQCGDKIFDEKPDSYFAEFYIKESEYVSDLRKNKTVFEAENAFVATPGGFNKNTNTYIEESATAGGGKSVGNISRAGNYIRFDVVARSELTVDLVLVLANVRWSEEGIMALKPMSDYVSLKLYNEACGTFSNETLQDGKTLVPDAKAANSGKGIEFNFDYIDFPATPAQFNYFAWRHVVMRNVVLAEGLNNLVFRPIGASGVTIPNTDALWVFGL